MITREALPVPTLKTAIAVTQFSRARWLLVFLWLMLSASTWGQAQEPAPAPAPAADPTTTNEPVVEPQEATTEPGVTEPAASEPEAPVYASRSERDNQLLALANPEEVRWLETPSGQILALFRPTENRTTKGVLLILHAAETPPGWPSMLENARRNLPQHGWVTMALALPAKMPVPIPARELPAAVESSEEPADDAEPGAENAAPEVAEPEPADPATDPAAAPDPGTATETPTPEPVPQLTRTEIIAERVGAALAWLAQENYTPVLLLVDNSSVVESLAFFQTVPNNPVTLLALANLQAQEELTTTELDGIFAGQTLPVMDIFFAPAQGQMTEARKRHRASALRNDVAVYQQLHILPPQQTTLDDSMSFWVERLRGFMEQQTQGKTKR